MTGTDFALPLSVPPRQPNTVVTVTLSAKDVDPVSSMFTYEGKADTGLTLESAATQLPEPDGSYTFQVGFVDVAGIQSVELTASSSITIRSASGCNVDAGGTTVTCESPEDEQIVELALVPAQPVTEPVAVSVSLRAPGYTEVPDTNPNSVDVHLQPAPEPDVPLGFGSGPTATETGTSNVYDFAVTVVGIPDGTNSISFRAARNDGNVGSWGTVLASSGTCHADGARLVCTGPDHDARALTLTGQVTLPGRPDFALTVAVEGEEPLTAPFAYLPDRPGVTAARSGMKVP